jgi:MFS family permease
MLFPSQLLSLALFRNHPWLIAITVMIATFMEVMDTSIASVAVPYIAGSTASTNDEAEWVLTVYLAANAVFLPASTWLALRFGRKRFLMFSVVVFTIASFACGIAPTLPLVLLRAQSRGLVAERSSAYVDVLRYLSLLCAACIPLAFFLKRPSPGARGAG